MRSGGPPRASAPTGARTPPRDGGRGKPLPYGGGRDAGAERRAAEGVGPYGSADAAAGRNATEGCGEFVQAANSPHPSVYMIPVPPGDQRSPLR